MEKSLTVKELRSLLSTLDDEMKIVVAYDSGYGRYGDSWNDIEIVILDNVLYIGEPYIQKEKGASLLRTAE